MFTLAGLSLVFGFTGNVENGPSCTERLLGGRPRNFPEAVPVVEGHALETAGVWRRRFREGGDDLVVLVEGWADLGSFMEGEAEKAWRGVMADCGYGDDGASLLLLNR